jgi:uncharacterized repeat protein (TIGR01451 family)
MDPDLQVGPSAVSRYGSFVYDPVYWWTLDPYIWDGLEAATAYSRPFRLSDTWGETEKLADPEVVGPGENVDYTLALYNPSAEDMPLFVKDMLPEEVEFVSASAGATYDAVNHAVMWSGVVSGTSLTTTDIDITVKVMDDVDEGTIIENDAEVSNKFDGASIWDMSADVLVDDGMNPDLMVEKTVDKLIGRSGDKLLYTITLENMGDEDAMDAYIEDVIPDFLVVDESSITGGATYDDGTIMWEGDLAVGASVEITFMVVVTADAPVDWVLLNAAISGADNTWWESYNSAVTEVMPFYYTYMPVLVK